MWQQPRSRGPKEIFQIKLPLVDEVDIVITLGSLAQMDERPVEARESAVRFRGGPLARSQMVTAGGLYPPTVGSIPTELTTAWPRG